MESSTESRRKTRSANACSRCRRQKIKCSGAQPCEACAGRSIACVYDADPPKILVTKRYISELRDRIASLEAEHLDRPLTATSLVSPRSSEAAAPELAHHDQSPRPTSSMRGGDDDDDDNEAVRMINPLSAKPMHMLDQAGNPVYFGHSSNWSFTQKVLRLTHKRLCRTLFPAGISDVDARPYDLGWDGTRTATMPDASPLPSLDYSIYLINTVKFRTGQIYHLFDEDAFMVQLYRFYDDPDGGKRTMHLWYIHFLIILAFGKAFLAGDSRSENPPGSDLFVRASMLLPSIDFLSRDPLTSTEILCCMALYREALDDRLAARNLIGQALHMALYTGMHTDMQRNSIGDHIIRRCRKIWWTAFVLDRQISALLGLPITIRDSDITAPLPAFASTQKTAAAEVHVKLSRALAQVVNTVYGINGRLDNTFVSTTEDVLRRVASVANELETHFGLPSAGATQGLSHVSGYLNVLYHQCILVATRPFLFSFLEKKLESLEAGVPFSVPSSSPVFLLIQTCIESAKKIVRILSTLQEQSLLETFISFQLESAFSAGMVISIASAFVPNLGHSTDESASAFESIYSVLNEMVHKGNRVAKIRITELRHLEFVLEESGIVFSSPHSYMRSVGASTGSVGGDSTTRLSISGITRDTETPTQKPLALDDEWNVPEMLTSSHLSLVADLLGSQDMADWPFTGIDLQE